jgi:hypothetical protein
VTGFVVPPSREAAAGFVGYNSAVQEYIVGADHFERY